MATIAIRQQDADRLQALAQQENRSVEELVSDLIVDYEAQHPVGAAPQPEQKRSRYMTKLYAYARRYWHSVEDTARLALTDEQLDTQFWCIDPEGIPRLYADQGQVSVPEDRLSAFMEAVWAANPTGDVEEPIDYRQILRQDFVTHLMRGTQDSDAQSSTD